MRRFILILLLSWGSGVLSAATCSIDDLQDCDMLYRNGQYELLVNSFNLVDLASTTNARLSRYYYLAIGYYGLFKHEQAVSLKCEFLNAAKLFRYKFSREVIKSFASSSDFGVSQARTKVLFMRNIAWQMDNHRGCIEPPYSEARVDYLIDQNVRKELNRYATFAVDPELNPLSELSETIRGFMTISSNAMNKNNSYLLELEGLAYTLKGIQQKLELWQQEPQNEENPSLDIDGLRDRNQTWQDQLNAIDVSGLVVDLAAKEKNNETATELIKSYFYATKYTNLFNPMRNEPYRIYKTETQFLVSSVNGNSLGNDVTLLFEQIKMNTYERDKPYFPVDICQHETLKKRWYCQ